MLVLDIMCRSVCLYVFFFKQKTAYEMRISDWSSDVCSSDLSLSTVRTGKENRPGINNVLRLVRTAVGNNGLRTSDNNVDNRDFLLSSFDEERDIIFPGSEHLAGRLWPCRKGVHKRPRKGQGRPASVQATQIREGGDRKSKSKN